MNLPKILRAIGIDLGNLKEINIIKIDRSIDNSTHIEGSTVVINPDKHSGKQRRSLKQFLRREGLENAKAIVAENCSPVVQAVVETLPSMKAEAEKFLKVIPPNDLPLLDACLYLRKRFEAGVKVDGLKRQISSVFGTRGGNFANLVSAGYLESWFSPLLDQLTAAFPNDPQLVREKFLVHYNVILNELPWTEFVASGTSAARVTAHIVEKMKRNLESGIRHINIHGLGPANVRKIRKLLPDVEKQTGATSKIDGDATRIFVRLEIPPKQLGSGQSGS
jgi:hypothetical protein